MNGASAFPDPTYRETVLAPLFEAAKTHYAEHFGAINKAHLVMLCETGILSEDRGRRIAGALRDLDRDFDAGSLAYTGEFEDFFFQFESELVQRLGDLGGMLHIARSRNDMDHTMFRLALRERAERLMAQLIDLAAEFVAKARGERDTVIVAYTHGQPAQPTTFGHYLSAAVETILRDAERIESAIAILDKCPMGAAAITTSGFPIDRRRTSQLLGFPEPVLNSYGCIASVDYITGLYSAIKLAFLHLGRVIQDLAQWSAFEVGQLRIPDSLVQISSIMPQKRNPVSVEHMRLLSSLAIGYCDTTVNAMHNTPFADMNDSETEVQLTGYKAFECGGRALSLLSACVSACSIDSERVAANGDAACITITELADTLVREEGLYFRQAHEIASETARGVIENGERLRNGFNGFRAAFEARTGRPTRLAEREFAEAIGPEAFISRRDRLGGPARPALDSAIAEYERGVRGFRRRHAMRAATRRKASASLEAAFEALLEG